MTVEAFRAAIEEHDLDATMEVFADEVTFHSPIVFKTYPGKDELRFVLSGVMHVLEDFLTSVSIVLKKVRSFTSARGSMTASSMASTCCTSEPMVFATTSL